MPTVMAVRIVLLALTVLLLAVPAADACKCARPGDPAEEIEQADAAFYGKVVGVHAFSIYGASYRFRVKNDFKDNLGSKIRVLTPGETAACGLRLSKGDTLGLLLYRDNGTWNGYSCSVRTRAFLRRGSVAASRAGSHSLLEEIGEAVLARVGDDRRARWPVECRRQDVATA